MVWDDTLKASLSGYDRSDNVEHQNFIQVLHPVKMYHFDDLCMCFTKDDKDDGFIGRLKNLPIIFNDTIYDIKKIDEGNFRDHVFNSTILKSQEGRSLKHNSLPDKLLKKLKQRK